MGEENLGYVNVLFQNAQGIICLNGSQTVFQNRRSKTKPKVGLGVIDMSTYVDRGKIAFADMDNVVSVIPDAYFTLDYFENLGVPKRVYKGTYGDSIILKEEYHNRTIIKALDEEGSLLLKENEKNRKGNFNVFYYRLNNAVGDWVEFTEELITVLISEVSNKKSDLALDNPYILLSLKEIRHKNMVLTTNGVLLAQGYHETMLLWGKDGKVSITWFGRLLTELNDTHDVTEQIRNNIRDLKVY